MALYLGLLYLVVGPIGIGPRRRALVGLLGMAVLAPLALFGILNPLVDTSNPTATVDFAVRPSAERTAMRRVTRCCSGGTEVLVSSTGEDRPRPRGAPAAPVTLAVRPLVPPRSATEAA